MNFLDAFNVVIMKLPFFIRVLFSIPFILLLMVMDDVEDDYN